MKKYYSFIGTFFLLTCFSLLVVNSSFAESYYKDKIITVIVPHSAGGGTDIFARIITKHLPKHIPGKPTMIVRNMTGAMTLVGGNYVYNIAKKDGLTIMAGSGVAAMQSFLGTKGTKFSFENMPICLAIPGGTMFFANSKLFSKSEDFVKVSNQLVFGMPPLPWPLTVEFLLVQKLLNFETKKNVLAYDSSADVRRAFLSGEVDITGESSVGYGKSIFPLVKKGKAVPLWQSGIYDPKGNMIREGGVVSDVPTVEEFCTKNMKKSPQGPAWDALAAYVAYDRTLGKTILLPPDTEKYASIIRSAIEQMVMKDEKFKKDAVKIFHGAPIFTGQDAVALLNIASKKAQPIRKWLKSWLADEYGVKFEN
ncbi:hypothetical protein ACFLZL_02385 [Thermodesulfobacteriota bacterium]